MVEKLTDCGDCEELGSLIRIPQSNFRTTSSSTAVIRPGELVKEFIEDTRREIQEYKKDLTKEINDV
jgi:hypothetical protein